jgi:hypothetical protein
VWPLSVSFDPFPVIIKKITQATLLEPFLALPFSCGYQNLHSEATLLEPFLASAKNVLRVWPL